MRCLQRVHAPGAGLGFARYSRENTRRRRIRSALSIRRARSAVRSAGVRAKIRTGGVTPDAFPPPEEIVRFLRRCMEVGVTAKATAGLHHPLRGEYRLTYAPDAVRGVMYGYLNVFLAAAAMRAGAPDDVATEMLTLTDASAIAISAASLSVCGFEITDAVLAATRTDALVAFGSCSFREPVDELAVLSASRAS